MADDLRSALQQVGDDWDSVAQDPKFTALTPDEQSKARHWFYTNKVVNHPTIEAALPQDPSLGPRLHHAFMDPETAQMDEKAAAGNRSLWDQPLSRGLGIKAEDIADPIKSPLAYGAAKFVEGMTTPKQIGIMGAAVAAPEVLGAGLLGMGVGAETVAGVSAGLKGVLDAGFSLDMLHSALKEAPGLWSAFNYAQQLENQGRVPESEAAYAQVKSELVQMAAGGFFTAMAGRGAREQFRFLSDWKNLPADMRAEAIRGGMDPLHPSSVEFARGATRANAHPGPGHPEYEAGMTQAAKESKSPSEADEYSRKAGEWIAENKRRRAIDQPDISWKEWSTGEKPSAPSPMPTAERPPQAAARNPETPRETPIEAREEPDYIKRQLSVTRTGETFVEKQARPDADTAQSRAMIRFKQASDAADKAQDAGHAADLRKEAASHLYTWARYASPEDFKSTLENIEKPLRQDFEDHKIVMAELGRRAADKAGSPASDFPREIGDEQRLLDAVNRTLGQKNRVRKLLPGNEQLAKVAATLQGKVEKGRGLVEALTKGKQATSALLQEIDAARDTEGNLLGRAAKKVYPSPEATKEPAGPIAGQAIKEQPTAQTIGDKSFKFAATAMKEGKRVFGAGNFKVVEKQGKFYVKEFRSTESSQVSARPEVGRTSQASPSPIPKSEPVQAAESAAGSREPVRPTEGPKIEPLPPVQKMPGGQTITDPEAMATINRDLERRGLGTPGENQRRRVGDEPRSAARSQALSVAKLLIDRPELRTFFDQAADKLGVTRDLSKLGDLDRSRVISEANRLHSEWASKQRGSVSFGPDEPFGERRARKIDEWFKTLKDPKASPEAIDGAFKMLKAYGLSQDEILQRMTGAEGFAVDPRTGIPEPSQEALEERIDLTGRGPIDALDRAVAKFEEGIYGTPVKGPPLIGPPVPGSKGMDIIPWEGTEAPAWREAHRKGQADIGGIKSPAVEELERMVKMPDPRGERSSGLGVPRSKEIFEARVNELLKRHPDMDRRTAEDMAREFLDRERGSLSLRSLRKAVLGNKPEQSIPARLLKALDDVIGESDVSTFTKGVLRAAGGYRARTIDQLVEKFRDIEKLHDGNTTYDDLIAFNNAGEGKPGATFLHPQDQAIATEFHHIWQDTLWPALKRVRPDKFAGAGIENYLGRLFKGTRGQQIAAASFDARRPFEGRKGFTHARVYEWIDEAIGQGAEPITNNPITMQLEAMNQVIKYISANEAFNDVKGVGAAQWVRRGTRPPSGWAKVQDPIFQPNNAHGSYWAHPDVAKLFNRWLAPGLHGNVGYDTLRTVGDTMNMMQLGFSAFHFTFTTVAGAMTSDMSLAIQKFFRLDAGGFKDLGRVMMPWKTYQLGNMMEQEWLNPGTHPWLSRYADLAEDVGGRLGTGRLGDRSRVQAFKEESLSLMKVAKAVPALAEFTSRKLMQTYVPRVKLGIFQRMAADAYERLTLAGADEAQIRAKVGKIWDSVDNRAGLMVYDNRFIYRTMKDVLQLSIRSTGWNWGTLQELLGGTADIGKYAFRKITGRTAELSTRAAYTMALPIVAGGLGAIIGYLSGNPPQKLEDYFFPRIGGTDAGGQPTRLSLPTYMRDVFAYAENPASTFAHKFHPMIQDLIELYRNEDFYNVEIRREGAPWLEQAYDVSKYVAKQFVPISVTSATRRWETEETPSEKIKASAESEFGFTPAPKYIGETKAEEDAYTLAKRHRMAGPKTQENYDHYRLLTHLEQKWDAGTLRTEELNAALNSGRITDDDFDKLFEERELTPFQRNFKALEMEEALRVMEEATKEERVNLLPILEDKYLNRIDTFTPEQADHYDKLIQGYDVAQ
jgi:hypothetical protein